MDRLKSLRLHVTFGSLGVVVLGIIFLAWPGAIANTIAKIIGIILTLIGATQFFGKLLGKENRSSGMLVGALITVIGIWVVLHPTQAASIIPMIIGVVLTVHGIQDFSLAFAGRKVRMPHWGIGLAIGVIDIVMGIFCIVCAFQTVTIALQIMGIMMIYDGLTGMMVVHRVNRAEKDIVDSRIIEEDDI